MRIVAYGESMGSGGYVRYCQGVFGNGATAPDVQACSVCSEPLVEVNASSLDGTRGDDLARGSDGPRVWLPAPRRMRMTQLNAFCVACGAAQKRFLVMAWDER